jgi:signal transduction histidine kinase
MAWLFRWKPRLRSTGSAKRLYATFQKHAGDVPVSVQLQARGTCLDLRIQDAGPGFDTHATDAGEHLGLVSMQERAGLIGAVCKCISRPGEGTTIQVRLIADCVADSGRDAPEFLVPPRT